METSDKKLITVQSSINALVEKVWELWTDVEHIKKWNAASEDWHTTSAENDLRAGGKFTSRMEAKDGSFGFDFWGIYDEIKTNELIIYTLGDNRKVKIIFSSSGNSTTVVSTFEAENSNPVEMQKNGWQSILDNFKKYVESH